LSRLAIVLECPKCGGPYTVDDEIVSRRCEHCGSLLVLSAPERDELYVAESRVDDVPALAEIVVRYRVTAQRAEIVSRHQDSDGNPPSESFVQAQLRAFEELLRGTLRVTSAHAFQAPYWHISGAVVQGILGREHEGAKQVRLRAFALEHTIPAYDVARVNLRDRGLRLAASRVRPLTVRDVEHGGPFLPWQAVAERSYREIDKWRGQDLDPTIEPVTKFGLFLSGRRVLVYRRYWLARVLSHAGQEWVLVDASFETIGGYPGETEVQELLQQAVPDPRCSLEQSYRRAHLIPSRCPDCGFELAWDERCRVIACPNCHRGLAAEPEGIRLVSYAHAEGAGDEYVPFWRYSFEIRVGDRAVVSLEDYGRALFGARPPPAFHAAGRHLWIPAARLMGTEIGDRAFQGLVQVLHGAPPAVRDEKVPLGVGAVLWGASLSDAEARTLAPFVLLGLHGPASASQLSTLLVRKAVQGATVALSEPTLVMVPFRRESDLLLRDAARLPSLLLRGGPELEAQRADVHATRRSQAGV
jgi:hypothetical protein